MNSDLALVAQALGGSVVSILLWGNIYFVKKLVEKVENTGEGHEEVKSSVSQLSIKMSEIAAKITDIKQDLKEFRKVEIEVAVIKSQLNGSREPLTN